MKRCFHALAVWLVLCPALVMAQYYPGKITDYTIGRPQAKRVVKTATKAQLGAVERMRTASKKPLDVKYNENGVPYLVSGRFTTEAKGGSDVEADVRSFLRENKEIFRMRDPETELSTRSDETGLLGLRTIRFAQRCDGIPVYGGDLVVNLDAAGALTSVNGNYLPEISVDTQPNVTAEDAVAVAKGALGISDDDVHNTIGPNLMIYPFRGVYHLAWRLTLVTKDPFAEWKCFVDAKAGTLIEKWNDAKYQDAMLTGIGVLGETLTLHGYNQNWSCAYWLDWHPWAIPPYWDMYCSYNLPGYGLADTSKAMFNPSTGEGYIGTMSAGAQDVTSIYQPMCVCSRYTTDFTTISGGANTVWDFSGHYNAGLVYDYWQSRFGRNSIDNNGMTVNVNVNCMFGDDATNAMWSTGVSWFPEGAVFFGRGDWVTALGQSGSLSCVTHELTHGVTNYTCNLEYRNQSGAINEAFSDSFACALQNRWQYNAEGCWLASPGYCRSLENPHLGYPPDQFPFGSLPAHMDEYVNTQQDNGGVHINMSIISHAFYLICQAIGVGKGEQVWYRTQTAYCTTTTDFNQLRDLALQACSDLYGQGDEYYYVMNSFAEVGIGSGVTIVSKGQLLSVAVAVPPIVGSPFGYNAYSVVTTPEGRVLTVWNNSFQPFKGRVAQLGGVPYGYSGYVLNTLVPSIPLGNYLFETALIPSNLPQQRGNAVYYDSLTVRVR